VESRDADVPARPWDRCSTSMATETSYWEYAGTAPFSFVDDVAKAIAAAREFVGDRDVDVATGQIGSQALKLGLIDQVVLNVVPVAFGSGHPPGLRRQALTPRGCTTGLERSRGSARALLYKEE